MNTPIDKSIFNETGCIRMEQLLRYRDHQLSSIEQHKVEEHLVDCELCSDALEGLALISGTATLDASRKEVSGITVPASPHSFRPWLVAASIAGAVLFSVFTYFQFKEVTSEQLAVKDTVAAVKELPPPLAATGAALSENTQELKAVPQPKILNDELVVQQQNTLMKEKNSVASSGAVVSAEEADDAQSYVQEASSVSKMEVPAAAAKDIAPVSTAFKNTGNQNITYVDNVKVIDYNNYNTDNAKLADAPRGTSSNYQSAKKQQEAAAAEQKAGISKSSNADYLDLVADPVILFNNGRYESANAGFDKLLKLNSNDQNAAFYKGLSLYNMKQYDPALELLVPISNDSASPFMEEAKFYAAQTYISNNAVPQGKKLLEEIFNNNGFYSKKAAEVLRGIK